MRWTTSYTLKRKFYTLNKKPYTLNRKPYTLKRKFIMSPSFTT